MNQLLVSEDHEEIIKKILILFNVKSSPVEETKILKSVKQEELEQAFEYWLDQSKLVFAGIPKLEKMHSLKEAGIDILFNLIQSNFKLGIQIKTYSDIEKDDFSVHTLFQIRQSLKHKLSKFLVAFSGDMTDSSQLQKVQGMTSELSQEGDNNVISLSPEKVLTIYKAFKSNQHPLKFVFLDHSETATLLNGIVENLNNEKREVKINIMFRNLETDNIERPREWKLNLSLDKKDKNQLRMLDDLQNFPITDDVVKIDDSTVNDFNIADDGNDGNPSPVDTELLGWVSKPGRKLIVFQTISNQGQVIQSHKQLVDRETEEGLVVLSPKDMQNPLKIGIRLDIKSSMGQPFFEWNLHQHDVKSVYEKLIFLSSLGNSTRLRALLVENNIDSPIPIRSPNLIIDPRILELFRTLSTVQDLTGCRIVIPESAELEKNIEAYLSNSRILLFICQTKIIPKMDMTFKIRLSKKYAMALLTDYSNDLIKYDLMYPTTYSLEVFNTRVDILFAQLNLSRLSPITELSNIQKLSDDVVEIQLKFKEMQNP